VEAKVMFATAAKAAASKYRAAGYFLIILRLGNGTLG